MLEYENLMNVQAFERKLLAFLHNTREQVM